jgi:hypothetical protein
MQVRLSVPEQLRNRPPKLHGEWVGYHDRVGRVLAGAVSGGVWVEFEAGKYVGCPVKHLSKP